MKGTGAERGCAMPEGDRREREGPARRDRPTGESYLAAFVRVRFTSRDLYRPAALS